MPPFLGGRKFVISEKYPHHKTGLGQVNVPTIGLTHRQVQQKMPAIRSATGLSQTIFHLQLPAL
jgi:hypothetical protein